MPTCNRLKPALKYAFILFASAIVSNSDKTSSINLYAPRHWPSWIGFGLIWLLIHLPVSGLLGLSRVLGKLLYHTAKRRRRIAEINIRLCFPDRDEQQHQQLVLDHFSAMVMGIFEMGMAWWVSDKRLTDILDVKGQEHLDKALTQGNGVILFSAHFSCLELAGRFYSMKIPHPWSGMYRPHENPVLEHMFQRDRKRFFSQLIPREDIRSFLRRLKVNETTWYAPDQNYRKKGHVMAPFFGIPAATNPATSKLAKISGAVVIPFEYRRQPNNRYLLQFHPALENFPTGDDLADATRINQVFEDMIHRAPEQYFWLHRRFKLSRDKGDVYSEQGL